MADEVVRDRLRHMLDAIAAIEGYIEDVSAESFAANRMLRDAVERNIERLSEASRHLPQALQQKHPEVDWRGVATIGNVLRHAYHRVANRRIWQIVTEDLPPLKMALMAMMKEAGEQ